MAQGLLILALVLTVVLAFNFFTIKAFKLPDAKRKKYRQITLVVYGFLMLSIGLIFLKSGEKSPFPFKLTIFLSEKESTRTEGYIEFDGEVNAFLKMMVEKPLLSLFNYMSNKLDKHFS